MATRTRSRAIERDNDQALVHLVMAFLVMAVLSFEQAIMTASVAGEGDCPTSIMMEGMACE